MPTLKDLMSSLFRKDVEESNPNALNSSDSDLSDSENPSPDITSGLSHIKIAEVLDIRLEGTETDYTAKAQQIDINGLAINTPEGVFPLGIGVEQKIQAERELKVSPLMTIEVMNAIASSIIHNLKRQTTLDDLVQASDKAVDTFEESRNNMSEALRSINTLSFENLPLNHVEPVVQSTLPTRDEYMAIQEDRNQVLGAIKTRNQQRASRLETFDSEVADMVERKEAFKPQVKMVDSHAEIEHRANEFSSIARAENAINNMFHMLFGLIENGLMTPPNSPVNGESTNHSLVVNHGSEDGYAADDSDDESLSSSSCSM